MNNDKCPWPDGYNPDFYKHFWSNCGNDVFEAVRGWLNTRIFPTNLNSTNITLIPKGDIQNSMKDWRPVALMFSTKLWRKCWPTD